MTAAHFTLWTTKQTQTHTHMHAHTLISGKSPLWEKQTNLFSLTIDIFRIKLPARPFHSGCSHGSASVGGGTVHLHQQLASSTPPQYRLFLSFKHVHIKGTDLCIWKQECIMQHALHTSVHGRHGTSNQNLNRWLLGVFSALTYVILVGPKRENYIMRSLMICTPHPILCG